MKYLLILIFVFGFYTKTVAQQKTDCQKYIETTVDEVTGDTSIGSKVAVIFTNQNGKATMSVSVHRYSGAIAISISTFLDVCIDAESKVNLLFTDGTRMELVNIMEFNCDGSTLLYLDGSDIDKIETLSTKTIKTIRVATYKSFVQENFTATKANAFMHSIDCISKIDK